VSIAYASSSIRAASRSRIDLLGGGAGWIDGSLEDNIEWNDGLRKCRTPECSGVARRSRTTDIDHGEFVFLDENRCMHHVAPPSTPDTAIRSSAVDVSSEVKMTDATADHQIQSILGARPTLGLAPKLTADRADGLTVEVQ
jgi:hypothetical protein